MKYTLATVVGLMLFSIVMTVISIISIAGMMASEGMSAPIEKKSILKISLSGAMEERSEDGSMPFDISALTGGETGIIGLEQALTALEKAADNKNVVGVYLEGGPLAATPAMTQELRQAILRFKESGKWVIAYGDNYTKNSY